MSKVISQISGDVDYNNEILQSQKNQKQFKSIFSMTFPTWEKILYASVIVIVFAYAHYDFYVGACKLMPKEDSAMWEYESGLFTGWKEYGSKSFRRYQKRIPTNLLFFACFIIASQVGKRCFSSNGHKICCCLFSMGYTYYVSSFQTIFYFNMSIIIVLWLSSFWKFASHVFVATAFVALESNYFTDLFFPALDISYKLLNVFFPMYCYLFCRLISLGHHTGQQNEKEKLQPLEFIKKHLLDGFYYIFYFPYYINGPIMIYADFKANIAVSAIANIKWLRTLWRAVRLFSYYWLLRLINNIFYYFAYYDTMRNDDQLEKVPFKYVSLSGYMITTLFTMHYMLIYGVPGIVAHLDGIELYDWPRCSTSVHSFRNMWRVWDIGFTKIIKHHIYIPLGGNRHGKLRQLISLLVTFMFVVCYHGFTTDIFVYVGFNCLQVVLEVYTERFFNAFLRNYLLNKIGEIWLRRFVAFCATFSWLIGSFGILMFCANRPQNEPMAFRYVRYMIQVPSIYDPHLIAKLLYIITIYCCINFTFLYENHLAKSNKENEKTKSE